MTGVAQVKAGAGSRNMAEEGGGQGVALSPPARAGREGLDISPGVHALPHHTMCVDNQRHGDLTPEEPLKALAHLADFLLPPLSQAPSLNQARQLLSSSRRLRSARESDIFLSVLEFL